MDDDSIRRFERLTRVITFGRDHAADITPGSLIATLLPELDPIEAQLTLARVGQIRTPVGKPALIEALNLDFKEISRTARAIKLGEPDFNADPFRHPATDTETIVATHADSLLQLLEDAAGDTPAQVAAKAALRAKFIAYELPADFVVDLRQDRDALDQRNDEKHSDNHEGVESTAAIEALLAEAKAIITRLDAAFLNKFRLDPAKTAAWKSASRVERAPRKSTPPAEPPVTPPPTP